ncbi:CHAP domain-containing protein [Ruminococcus sp.]|uniref:CHAP domain-containing protein n=1 Tax=Ruminococcus sp. TaxID=41978 RepID=UPI001B5F6191|nr:CHAP domain-containing protein [Ruminococcus sp.]MBP5433238.1 CHAP domain-containing protein [Ruminococcus sp.]
MPFTPQLTVPADTDPYFIRKAYGGYSPCIKGNPEKFPGSPLANCVGYAWGIAAEREGTPNCNIGFVSGTTWPTNAWYWIQNPNGRQTGSTPQLGAIACWRNSDWTNGHVASVEQINADGSWLASESGYNGYIFRTHTYPADNSKPGFIFQGFIYLNWPEDPPLPPSGDTDVLYPIALGDKVRIIGKGRASVDGGGNIAYGIGWERYVTAIYEDGAYPFRVGFKDGRTTGFYKADALEVIKKAETAVADLKVGDKVQIKKTGNANSYGTGRKAYGLRWIRYIKRIYPLREYPYMVGNSSGITGFYKADALKKL